VLQAYLASVTFCDAMVGRLLDALDSSPAANNTIIIFWSDNGWHFGEKQHLHKMTLWARSTRLPLIIKWPGVTQPGSVSAEPVTSTDLYPTCLAAAGLPSRPSQHLDGRNMQPLFAGKASLGREALFWHFPHYNGHPSSVPSSVIRKGAWKLIETFDPEGLELYNLGEDLSETRNFADEKPDLVRQLHRELDVWRRDIGAEMMRPNPNYDPTVETPTKGRKRNTNRAES
jgi:arylsulfatase A-like enzyme